VSPFEITSRAIEGGRVFVFWGELSRSSCQGLIEELIGPPGSFVVIDLSQLTRIDSSGLDAIARARHTMITDGGMLVVCRPRPDLRRALEIVGLDDWITDWDPYWWGPFISELIPDSVWARTIQPRGAGEENFFRLEAVGRCARSGTTTKITDPARKLPPAGKAGMQTSIRRWCDPIRGGPGSD
jgi:anti-anti-sigma factor